MSRNERISLAFIFRKNLWHPLSLALMKVFGFLVFYPLTRGVCIMVCACVCVCVYTRTLTRVVMNTGTQWYHFLTRMCVGGMRNLTLCVCVCSRDFSQHQSALEGLNFSFCVVVKYKKSRSFCSTHWPHSFILLSRSYFTVLCSLSSGQVVTETTRLLQHVCVSVWVQHWSLKKDFHIGKDWWLQAASSSGGRILRSFT